jgi:cell division protein FtsA
LGLPFEVAEEMKKMYGSVMPVYENKVETDSISENGHSISYQALCDIIKVRIEEIVRLIMLELPRSDYESLVPAGLVLTGGSSNLSGIDALSRDIIQLPSRVGTPAQIYGITDILHNPAYATSVGLLLWGRKPKETQTWKSHRFGFGLRHIVSRIKRLFQ